MPEGETTTTIPDAGSATPPPESGAASDGASSPDALSDGGSSEGTTVDSILTNEFKEKGWAKPLAGKPVDELFRQFDQLQTKLGQTATEYRIPGENATPDQQAQFRKMLGVPDTIDDYKMPEIQWSDNEKVSGEFLKGTRGEDFEKALKTKAHSLGLTPKQWEGLAEAYDREFVSRHSTQLAAYEKAQQDLTEDFSREAELLWGNQTDQVLEDTKRIVEKYAKKSVPHLNDMPNKYLLMMAETIDGFRKDLMTEDKFRASYPVMTSANTSTKDGIEQRVSELMKTPEYLQNPSSVKGKEVQQEINRLMTERSKFLK